MEEKTKEKIKEKTSFKKICYIANTELPEDCSGAILSVLPYFMPFYLNDTLD